MAKEDLFEVIKGNIQSINFKDVIQQRKDAFLEWVTPYHNEVQKAHYHPISFEPDWKAGQKRKMSQIFRSKSYDIHKLEMMELQLVELVFPNDSTSKYRYEIDITVKKTPIVYDKDGWEVEEAA